MIRRYAIVRGATAHEVEAYLPDNYRLDLCRVGEFVISGVDEAGWTLDGYVIPRLASGLIPAEEIDLSHPIMKEVPA